MKKSLLERVIQTRSQVHQSKPRIPNYSKILNSRFNCNCIPSLSSNLEIDASCMQKEKKIYTGNNIIGIATMHKSNAIPIFSEDQAKDISKMRR